MLRSLITTAIGAILIMFNGAQYNGQSYNDAGKQIVTGAETLAITLTASNLWFTCNVDDPDPTPTPEGIAITTIEELQLIGNDPGYPLDGDYYLANDIDASATAGWNEGAGFVPIGTSGSPFAGTLDGQGYTVDGLYINHPGPCGLFYHVSGEIKDTRFYNVNVSSGFGCGVIYTLLEGSSVDSVHVAGSVIGAIKQSSTSILLVV